MLSFIDAKMLKKLKDYTILVETTLAKLAWILGLLVKKDFINEVDVLLLYVVLPIVIAGGLVGDEERRTKNSIQDLLEKNSVDGLMDEKFTFFLKTTRSRDVSSEPLMRWGGKHGKISAPCYGLT